MWICAIWPTIGQSRCRTSTSIFHEISLVPPLYHYLHLLLATPGNHLFSISIFSSFWNCYVNGIILPVIFLRLSFFFFHSAWCSWDPCKLFSRWIVWSFFMLSSIPVVWLYLVLHFFLCFLNQWNLELQWDWGGTGGHLERRKVWGQMWIFLFSKWHLCVLGQKDVYTPSSFNTGGLERRKGTGQKKKYVVRQ